MAPPESELREPDSARLARFPAVPDADECEPTVVVTSKTEASAPLGDDVTVEMSVSTGASVRVPPELESVLRACSADDDEPADDAVPSDCDAAADDDDDAAADDALGRRELAVPDVAAVSDDAPLDRRAWVEPSTAAFS